MIPSVSASIWDPFSISKLEDTFVTYNNWKRNVNGSGYNLSVDDYKTSEEGLEWIKPENIFDVDDEDIESDLNTYVDIAGDKMSGSLSMDGNNINNVSNITADTFIGFHQGNTSQWNRSGTNVILSNINDKVSIGINPPISTFHVLDNTANTGAAAGFTIENNNNGDPTFQQLITAIQVWVFGPDRDDNDWKISASRDVGIDPYLIIDDTTGDFDFQSGNLNTAGDISTTQNFIVPNSPLTAPVGYRFTSIAGAPSIFYKNGSDMFYASTISPVVMNQFGFNSTFGFEMFGDARVGDDLLVRSQMALGDEGAITSDRLFDMDGSATSFGGVWTPSCNTNGGDCTGVAVRVDIDTGITKVNANALRILNPGGSGTLSGDSRGILFDAMTAGADNYLLFSSGLGKYQIQDDIEIDANSKKLLWGESQDASCYFDGTDFICNLEVGTTANYIFTNWNQVRIDTILNVSKNTTTNDLFLGQKQIPQDQFLYFFDSPGPTARWIKWDESSTEFQVSNRLLVPLLVSTGDILTSGPGDDLWLGNIVQEDARFRANATGDVQANHLNLAGNFTGNQIYANIRFHNDSGITIDLTTSEVYKPIFGYDITKINGFRFNETALEAIIPGNYETDWGISFSSGANAQHGFDVLVNTVPQDCHGHITITTGNSIGVASMPCVISLSVGDNVTLEVRDEAGAVSDPTFIEASLYLMRVGDVK